MMPTAGYAEQLPVSTLVVKNGSHTVSSVAPTRANAQFLGWTTERRAVQATDPVTGYYKAGDQLTALTADTTLYALWLEDARYSITYQDLAGVTLGGAAPPYLWTAIPISTGFPLPWTAQS